MASQSIIGIDLGTTYSCVAVWLPEWQRVEVVSNDQGNRTMPSCVAFTQSERLIGEPATSQSARNPQNSVFQVKRLMGRAFDDHIVQKNTKQWPFRVERNENDKPVVTVEWKGEEKKFRAEEISAMILSKMKEIAETKLGKGSVKKAVITVPAYFNNSQRQATKDAGTIAGLDVVRIINEPTAAAFAYGLDESLKGLAKRNVLVFDLGGGTFDVSILEIQGKDFSVKATGGDTNLGGEDFDDHLLNYLANDFKQKNGVDLLEDKRATRKLRTQCERAKRELSFQKTTTIDIDALYDGIDFVTTVSRVRLENLLNPFFQRCLDIVDKVIRDARLSKQQIEDVVLVGGSSRIPKIQEMLTLYFEGKNLCKAINPDEAVAYGAAIQGALLAEEVVEALQDVIIQDVSPLTLGVPGPGDLMAVIVPRNTTIPCSISKTRNTLKDNQTTMRLDIYQGERPQVKDNQLLGRFRLHGLEPAPKGVTKAVLTFNIDEDGILKVSAQEKDKDNQDEIVLTGEQLSLQNHEIEQMLELAEKYKEEDEEEKLRILSRVELDDMMYSMESNMYNVSNESLRNVLIYTVETERQWLENNQNAQRGQFEDKIKEIKLWLQQCENNIE